MITPFKENGEVDYAAFEANVHRWNTDTLAGYVVLGSNAETPFLSTEEKLALVELTVRIARKDRLIIAGTGLESTRETIRLTNNAAKIGVHAALVLTPHYYGERMNDEALVRFYTEVADSSDIPLLIYNVPKVTHFNISADTVKHLSQHPNIVGMKDSSGSIDLLKTYYHSVPREFNLTVGTVAIWFEALELGVRAGIHAAANCIPNLCSEIQTRFEENDRTWAKEIQERVLPVNKAVTATYGIPGLKYAATLMGYKGGSPRSPLLPLREEEQNDIKKILIAAKLFSND